MDHISVIRDARQAGKIERTLTDIIFLTIAAMVASAEGWEDLEDFGEDNLIGLDSMAILNKVYPCTIRLPELSTLSPLSNCNDALLCGCKDFHEVSNGEVIAIDGKILRGTYNNDKSYAAIHMVSAFGVANQVVLKLV
ncbi:ISAs1 family transposase [Vibrio cyclitrophicus 1F53]|uniref:ISAs1 family transposase n=1 Tax=Vibrio cyclitrophicus TaxID=47951 RepID=UPI0002F40AF3|nr:ISAs1 family transposase [Vibrio cyclitrophicus]